MKVLTEIFFSVKEETRPARKQCRLDIKQFSISKRTVNEWNKQSADCVGASSVNMFKNKIDIYLRRAGYILINQMASLSTCHLELIL